MADLIQLVPAVFQVELQAKHCDHVLKEEERKTGQKKTGLKNSSFLLHPSVESRTLSSSSSRAVFSSSSSSWLSSTFPFSRFPSVTQLGVNEEEEDDDVEITEANHENENVEDNQEDADDETHHNWATMTNYVFLYARTDAVPAVEMTMT